MDKYKEGYKQAVKDIQNAINDYGNKNKENTEAFQNKLEALHFVLCELHDMLLNLDN